MLPLPPLPPGTGYGVPYATAYSPNYPYAQGQPLPYASAPTYFLRPPRVWTVFVAFAVAFVAGMVGGGIVPLLIILLQHGGRFEDAESFIEATKTGMLRPAVLLSSGAATQLMLLITALSAAILSPVRVVRRLRLNPSTLSPLGYIIAPIGALAISVSFSCVVTVLGIHPSGTLKLLDDVFKKLTPTEFAFAVFIVGIMPGFAEEFLFRGYAQTRLAQRWGRWPGIMIASLMFGIMHMDPLQSPFAFAFGIYLGYLAEKCGSIRPTMLCHAANNSLMVALGSLPSSAAEPSRGAAAIMGAIAIGVAVLCTLYIRFRVQPPVVAMEPLPQDSILSAPIIMPPSAIV